MKEEDAVQLITYLLGFVQTLMAPDCELYHQDEIPGKTKIFLDSVDIVIENWPYVPVSRTDIASDSRYELALEFHKHIKLPALL